MDEQFSVRETKAHLIRVEKTINNLRASCLGQDIPLTAILPKHFQNKNTEAQVEQIASQILFALVTVAKVESIPLDGLPECHVWLRDVTLYLLTQCSKEDRVCRQLVQLISLPRGVRALVFSSFPNGDGKELTEGTPPQLLKKLEVAWLYLITTHKLFEQVHTVYRELNALSQSLS